MSHVAVIGAGLDAPLHAVAHRWRYAQVRVPFGWNAPLRLGACGDAWHADGDAASLPPGGIERAWLSGRALAQQMHPTLSPDMALATSGVPGIP